MKKTNLIPPFVMLLAGAVAGIIMFFMRYELRRFLALLLTVLVVFYILGCVIKWLLDRFYKQIEEAEEEQRRLEEEELEKEGGAQDIENENGEKDGSVVQKNQ